MHENDPSYWHHTRGGSTPNWQLRQPIVAVKFENLEYLLCTNDCDAYKLN